MKLRSVLFSILLFASASAFASVHQAALTWVDSPDKATNPSLSYNVYRAALACPVTGTPTGATLLTNVSTASYNDSAVTVGQTYCYYVKATLSGTEANPTNDSGGTVPVAPATTLTVTVQ